jgi:WD40 repeat protein
VNEWRWSAAAFVRENLRNAQAMAISPDGQWLATFSLAVGTISNLRSNEAAAALGMFTVPDVRTAAFSSDGKWLVTGSDDGTVRVWDASKPKDEIQRLAPGGPVTAVALSSNSKYVAIGSTAGTSVALFQPAGHLPLAAGEVRALACSQAGQSRQLSSEEWKKYFDDEPIRFTCGTTVNRPSVPAT